MRLAKPIVTTYYSLLTTRYLLLTAHHLLLTTYYRRVHPVAHEREDALRDAARAGQRRQLPVGAVRAGAGVGVGGRRGPPPGE